MPRMANLLIHASGSVMNITQELEKRKRELSADEVKSIALLAHEVTQLTHKCIKRLSEEGMTHEGIAKLFKITAKRT